MDPGPHPYSDPNAGVLPLRPHHALIISDDGLWHVKSGATTTETAPMGSDDVSRWVETIT
jgi:hypothetical protein